MTESPRRSWRQAIRAFRHPRVLAIFFLGFSAGLPLLLIFGTLSVRLREAGIERSTLTFFSWAALGYSFKYIWAPLVDRLPLPGLTRRLGRRRAWLLVAQIAIALSMLGMALVDPQENLTLVGLAAVALGFSAATQDISIDAYRIEAVHRDLQAMMSSAYIAGYRVGMLVGGAGALELAAIFGSDEVYDPFGWTVAYACMALAMGVGLITTLVIREPARDPEAQAPPRGSTLRTTEDYLRFLGLFLVAVAAFVAAFVLTADLTEAARQTLTEAGLVKTLAGILSEAVRLAVSLGFAALVAGICVRLRAVPAAMLRETYVDPFTDFVHRYGKVAFLLLLLIGTYRVADIVLGAMSSVFYIDIGFTKEQIAFYSKTFGLFMTLLGGFLGGVLSVRYGMLRTLFLGALLSAATNLLFAAMAVVGNDPFFFAVVIVADNLSGGLAVAAFVAYLSSLTSVSFTATQYAIFSSIMTLGPKVLAGYSGMAVDAVGYEGFFIGTALIGVPILWLVWKVGRLTHGDGGGDGGDGAEIVEES
jgi:PAT family beta-lactamase induction signal transducer AmpG